MTELYFFANFSPWCPEISPHVECQLSFPAILKIFRPLWVYSVALLPLEKQNSPDQCINTLNTKQKIKEKNLFLYIL